MTTTVSVIPAQEATRRLLPFSLMLFLGYLSIGLPLAVLPLHVGKDLSFSSTIVGLVMATQFIATLLTRHVAGHMVDTRGAKPVLIMGTLISSAAAMIYGLSVWIPCGPIGGLIFLLLGRAVLGLGESLLITGILAWSIGAVGPPHAGRAMVWVGIAMFSAMGIGGPIGTDIMHVGGFGIVALVAAILPLAACMMAYAMSPIPLHPGRRLSFFTVVKEIWPFGGALALTTVGFGAMFSFLGLDYAERGWEGASYGLTAFGIAYVTARMVFGSLPDRLGGRRVARVTIPLQAIGLVLLWLAQNSWVALLGCFAMGGGYSLTFPALGVEAIRRVPPQNRGGAMGAYVAFSDIGLGMTGPLAGIIAGYVGYPSVFLLGAVASIVAFFCVTSLKGDG
ncbi:MFS transporter [Saccharibacter sp. 17.LH.SD]|uniref:MFS transporter n=1 Tax=Saccharibacter sp. 17.LH.SD TaxID=2689393 RepID=UPI00136C26B2|nr:MFS transporter [Saccharibacter sp. 17.LH.SD]MXV45087.1 MFS transporter [Saccharibacter sp. 17.LH.SD]